MIYSEIKKQKKKETRENTTGAKPIHLNLTYVIRPTETCACHGTKTWWQNVSRKSHLIRKVHSSSEVEF